MSINVGKSKKLWDKSASALRSGGYAKVDTIMLERCRKVWDIRVPYR